MATDMVRIGIVGLGTIGRIHAERITTLGGELAGADLDTDARKSFAEEFDAPTYPDHEELIEAGVDAVIVGVPNRFHEEIAVDALEAGLDVLVEKPLAHTLESAHRIADVARDAAGFCMVGFTMRYATLTRRVVELRNIGWFGSLSHVGVEYLRRNFVPGEERGWFTDPDLAGGGVLMDLGVHSIDLALYLLEYPAVLEVTGVTRSAFGEYEVNDAATALLRCADGRTVSVETTWKAPVEPSRRCVVRGEEAGAAFEISGSKLTLLTPDDERIETESIDPEDMHLAENRAFLEAVAGTRDPPVGTVEQALTVQRIIGAICESSEQDEAVAVPPS